MNHDSFYTKSSTHNFSASLNFEFASSIFELIQFEKFFDDWIKTSLKCPPSHWDICIRRLHHSLQFWYFLLLSLVNLNIFLIFALSYIFNATNKGTSYRFCRDVLGMEKSQIQFLLVLHQGSYTNGSALIYTLITAMCLTSVTYSGVSMVTSLTANKISHFLFLFLKSTPFWSNGFQWKLPTSFRELVRENKCSRKNWWLTLFQKKYIQHRKLASFAFPFFFISALTGFIYRWLRNLLDVDKTKSKQTHQKIVSWQILKKKKK